jgi:methyl-accepting chemotaxis protein
MAKTHLTFVIFSILISIVAVLTYTGYTLKRDVTKEMASYKEILLKQTRQDLKDYVDIAYSTMDTLYKDYYGHRLKNIIEAAEEGVLKSKQKQVDNEEITKVEAMKEAVEEIKSVKYDGGKGKIWISDITYPTPQIIMHPIIPQDESIPDKKYNCVRGKNIWAVALEIVTNSTTSDRDGFFYYPWNETKKDCSAPNVIKLTYVKLFPQWGWIIGTGILIDDVEEQLKKEIKIQIGAMKYDNNKGYFWLNDTNKSSPQYVMHPDPVREDKPLENELGKYKDAVQMFVKVCLENRPEEYGSGYHEYVTDKPTKEGGIKTDVSKVSYVRLYEPLGWIIGTGIYIDDIEEAAALKQREINQKVNYLLTDIIIATILIILFIAIMSYLVNRYFFPKAQSKITSMMVKKTIANEKKTDYKQSCTAISHASTVELNKIVRKHVWLAMAVGLIPIPLFNFVSVTAVQISMLSDIASKFGVTSSSEKVKTLLTSLVGGAIPLATSGHVARIIRAIPIVNHAVGFITMPMVSGASTYAVGKIFILHFSKGGTFSTFNPEDAKKDYVRIANEEQKSIG